MNTKHRQPPPVVATEQPDQPDKEIETIPSWAADENAYDVCTIGLDEWARDPRNQALLARIGITSFEAMAHNAPDADEGPPSSEVNVDDDSDEVITLTPVPKNVQQPLPAKCSDAPCAQLATRYALCQLEWNAAIRNGTNPHHMQSLNHEFRVNMQKHLLAVIAEQEQSSHDMMTTLITNATTAMRLDVHQALNGLRWLMAMMALALLAVIVAVWQW